MIELEDIRQSVIKITGKYSKDSNDNNKSKIHEGLYSIKIFNDRLATFLEEENSHLKSARDTMNAIDRILIKPIEVFDDFVERVANCYPTCTHQRMPNANNNNSFVPLQKLQAFYE